MTCEIPESHIMSPLLSTGLSDGIQADGLPGTGEHETNTRGANRTDARGPTSKANLHQNTVKPVKTNCWHF